MLKKAKSSFADDSIRLASICYAQFWVRSKQKVLIDWNVDWFIMFENKLNWLFFVRLPFLLNKIKFAWKSKWKNVFEIAFGCQSRDLRLQSITGMHLASHQQIFSLFENAELTNNQKKNIPLTKIRTPKKYINNIVRSQAA